MHVIELTSILLHRMKSENRAKALNWTLFANKKRFIADRLARELFKTTCRDFPVKKNGKFSVSGINLLLLIV
jgi:hypothetical protein